MAKGIIGTGLPLFAMQSFIDRSFKSDIATSGLFLILAASARVSAGVGLLVSTATSLSRASMRSSINVVYLLYCFRRFGVFSIRSSSLKNCLTWFLDAA